MKASELKYALPYCTRFDIWEQDGHWYVSINWYDKKIEDHIDEQIYDARGGEKKTKTLDAMYKFLLMEHIKAGVPASRIRVDLLTQCL